MDKKHWGKYVFLPGLLISVYYIEALIGAKCIFCDIPCGILNDAFQMCCMKCISIIINLNVSKN